MNKLFLFYLCFVSFNSINCMHLRYSSYIFLKDINKDSKFLTADMNEIEDDYDILHKLISEATQTIEINVLTKVLENLKKEEEKLKVEHDKLIQKKLLLITPNQGQRNYFRT